MTPRHLAIVLVLGLLFGCVHSYEQVQKLDAPKKLSRGQAIYVAVPIPGRYGQTTYPQSGFQTAQAIADAFRPYATSVETGKAPEDYDAALLIARGRGTDYLIVPVIAHWEERATEWSGKSDRIRIKLQVYDVGSGEPLDSVAIEGKSRWLTLGGDHPQELLPKPVGEYVASLFE